jgi:hypothetical protein
MLHCSKPRGDKKRRKSGPAYKGLHTLCAIERSTVRRWKQGEQTAAETGDGKPTKGQLKKKKIKKWKQNIGSWMHLYSFNR